MHVWACCLGQLPHHPQPCPVTWPVLPSGGIDSRPASCPHTTVDWAINACTCCPGMYMLPPVQLVFRVIFALLLHLPSASHPFTVQGTHGRLRMRRPHPLAPVLYLTLVHGFLTGGCAHAAWHLACVSPCLPRCQQT